MDVISLDTVFDEQAQLAEVLRLSDQEIWDLTTVGWGELKARVKHLVVGPEEHLLLYRDANQDCLVDDRWPLDHVVLSRLQLTSELAAISEYAPLLSECLRLGEVRPGPAGYLNRFRWQKFDVGPILWTGDPSRTHAVHHGLCLVLLRQCLAAVHAQPGVYRAVTCPTFTFESHPKGAVGAAVTGAWLTVHVHLGMLAEQIDVRRFVIAGDDEPAPVSET